VTKSCIDSTHIGQRFSSAERLMAAGRSAGSPIGPTPAHVRAGTSAAGDRNVRLPNASCVN
jgi:hypothetical protein